MKSNVLRLLLFLPLALGTSAFAEGPLPTGPSFRMETEMFRGDETTPVSRHKILFDGGVIYDIHETGDRWVTVFDPTRGRVILLDAKTRLQAHVSTEELVRAAAQLVTAARQAEKSDALGLNAKPVPLGEGHGYSIAFGPLRYEITTQAVTNPEVAQAYHELAVWAARLNVLRKRGAPPFARMTLGQKIAEESRLPLHLTLTISEGLSEEKYRAHHLVVERLSELDRKAIDQVGDQLATFRKVPLDEFPDE